MRKGLMVCALRPRAYPQQLPRVQVDFLARLADELHVVQDRPVLAVLEVRPYPPLRLTGLVKLLWRGLRDRSAGHVRDEARTEEDGEYAEVLCRVGYGNGPVPCAEGILDVRAEVIRKDHGDLTRGEGVSSGGRGRPGRRAHLVCSPYATFSLRNGRWAPKGREPLGVYPRGTA